mmetsp:Transcript_72433/g.193531  ORF Transcript_72433/g.193531 Transcript_72433/m.193531 type:complete len:99 (-) Transcript_72433:132-428(-)
MMRRLYLIVIFLYFEFLVLASHSVLPGGPENLLSVLLYRINEPSNRHTPRYIRHIAIRIRGGQSPADFNKSSSAENNSLHRQVRPIQVSNFRSQLWMK